jgi:hypothetical protein
MVITMKGDEVVPYRRLLYPYGDWEESYDGPSTLFGVVGQKKTVVPRSTGWQPQEEAVGGLALVTISNTVLGTEVASRFLVDDAQTMVLRRHFFSKANGANGAYVGVTSDEIFEKQVG